MRRIVRFNWPLYAAALTVLVVCIAVLGLVESALLRTGCAVASAGALWFLAGSLAASHVVYDRSDLHRGAWLERIFGDTQLRRAAVCHCGYDEISALLRGKFPGAVIQLFDHYDEATMSEPSIHRARRLYPPAPGTIAAPFAAWPAADASLDAVFGVLAIHELRAPAERSAWFAEARRSLAPGGRVIVIEHLRDPANFAAFGPGFLHFHSAANWRRDWERAGLRCADDFSLTPFLRVFVLCRHD